MNRPRAGYKVPPDLEKPGCMANIMLVNADGVHHGTEVDAPTTPRRVP